MKLKFKKNLTLSIPPFAIISRLSFIRLIKIIHEQRLEEKL